MEHEPCDLVKELKKQIKELKENKDVEEIKTILQNFQEEQKKGSKRFDNIETYIINKEIKNGLKAKLLKQIEIKQEDLEGKLKSTASKDELDNETGTIDSKLEDVRKEIRTYVYTSLAMTVTIIAALIAILQ